jgi:secondary thiamine-phosphate synthase enzyme
LTTFTSHIRISTEGDGDVQPLTDRVGTIVREAGVERGVAVVFVPGATAGVTTMEYEPGGVADLREALDRLIPRQGNYAHNRLNADTNSHAHIRAALMGPSESIPVEAGRLLLGTWQQIVLVDFDDRARERTVLVSVIS